MKNVNCYEVHLLNDALGFFFPLTPHPIDTFGNYEGLLLSEDDSGIGFYLTRTTIPLNTDAIIPFAQLKTIDFESMLKRVFSVGTLTELDGDLFLLQEIIKDIKNHKNN